MFQLILVPLPYPSPSGAIELTDEEREHLRKYRQYAQHSELYYAYQFIHAYTDEPFTSMLPEALFQVRQNPYLWYKGSSYSRRGCS